VDRKNNDVAALQARDLLRSYLDQWLATGFTGDVEEPSNRRLQDTADAYHAVQSYCEKYPPRIVPADDGLFALFGSQIIGNWKEGIRVDDPLANAEDEAARIFTLLIDAPWRDQVYKCRRCGKYGVLSRKPITIYKKGMHCPDCRHSATAERSTATLLKDQLEERLRLARAAWREWKPKHGDRKAWTLHRVNQGLKNGERIKINWITWHLKEIENADGGAR
jgi:hypothetical protein